MANPADIWSEAVTAATNAAKACNPTPIGVYQADLAGNRLSATEIVNEGDCGFAWVRIKPARGPFIKYLKENNLGSLSLYGGWQVSMSMFTSSQSVERKVAAAKAFVETLKKNGIERAWYESRLD
jgi:hypothetical protein